MISGARATECGERGDYLLANLVALVPALDDLEINAPGRSLPPQLHGHSAVRTESGENHFGSNKISQKRGATFRADAHSGSTKSKS